MWLRWLPRPHTRTHPTCPHTPYTLSHALPPLTPPLQVRIYQENAELVGVIGSVQKGENASAFAQADVAVALQPLPQWRCSWVGLDRRPKPPRLREPPRGATGGVSGGRWAGRAEGAAAAPLLDTLHCAGVLPGDHDLEQLTEWLLQGRSLLNNTKQALTFGLFASLLLMLLQLGAAWAGLPPPVSTAQLLWLLLLVVPLLALPLLVASIDPRNKKEIVPKNDDHLKDLPRLASYLLLRALPGAVGLNLLYASLLATVALPPPAPPALPPAAAPPSTGDATFDDASLLPSCFSAALLGPAAASRQHVLVCQQVVLLWLVLLLGFQAAGFAHRTLGTSDYSCPERRGAGVALAALLGATATGSAALVGPAIMAAAVSSTPWYAYVLGAGMALLAHATDTAVKRHDRRAFERTNKRMYLEFTTKLGMHSPIEPGHRTPTSYLDDNT